jgi:hypothetical protein
MAKKATAAKSGVKIKKTVCPITRREFLADAKPVNTTFNGIPMEVPIKEFSTGSFGWHLSNKTVIKVGQAPVSVQIGLVMTVVGSKEAKNQG